MSRKRILYVEDNFQNGRLIKKILTAKGYDVTLAESAETGLQLVEADEPDLILLDINMPGMDGKEAATRLKKSQHRAIPVVAITAMAMRGDKELILASGCDDYLAKPVNMVDLMDMVQKYIGPGESD